MDLYLIRHADAIPLGEEGITTDEERPLTPLGLEQARRLAPAFRRHGITLGAVASSPLVRARQTADELVQGLETPGLEVQEWTRLAPGGKRRKLAVQLAGLVNESLALVGHEPDLGELAAWLIGSRKVQIPLAKASVAYLRASGTPDKGTCTLVWLVTQEWMEC